MGRSSQQLVWHLIVLLILGCLLFFYNIGNRAIWSPDEDEYALVNREMVEDGHWIFPTATGKPYSIKPPLFNWIGSSVSVLYGEVNEFTSRIPSAVAGLAGVITLYFLGVLLFGARAGFLSALVLATCFLYINFARWIQINMLSTFFLTLTFLLFYWGYTNEQKRRWAYLLMYVPMGLGTLNMGPVNVVMPAIVIFFYLLVLRDLKQIFRLRLGWGILIYLMVVLPWYLAVSLKGDYAGNILVTTNLTRFFSSSWGHVQPFYYYLLTLPGNFLPWTLFLPGAVFLCVSQQAPEERIKLLFPIVWAVSLFVFFSLSQCKRSEYILPLFPALALLVGFFFHKSIDWWNDSIVWRRWIIWPTYLLVALLFIAAVGLPVYCMIKSPDWTGTVIPLSLILLILGSTVIVFLRKGQILLTVVSIGVLLTGMVVYASGPIFSKANGYKSTRSFCLRVKERIPENTTLKMYGYYRPSYAFYADRFVEYTEDPATLLSWFTAEAPQYVVMKKKDFAQIKDAFPLTLYLIDEWEGYRHMVLVSNQSETDV